MPSGGKGRQPKSQKNKKAYLFESLDFIKLSRPVKLFVLVVFVMEGVGVVEVVVACFVKTLVIVLLFLVSISLFFIFFRFVGDELGL